MKIILVTFLLSASSYFYAQKMDVNNPRYSFCNWDNISVNENYSPKANDTCLFLVSSRNYNPLSKEFLDYDFDTTNTLHYFVIYFSGNNWVAVPHTTLTSMLNKKIQLNDLVIFTEGLGKTLPKGINKATGMRRLYDVDVLFFDWPTERPYMKSGKNIKTTYRVAPKVSKAYGLFLEQFAMYKKQNVQNFKNVTLLNHSMGNLLMMYMLKENNLKFDLSQFADNVVLNAACVNESNHKEWLDNLSFSKRIFVTSNNRDKNLRVARVLFGGIQLGVKVKSKKCERANYVDFSDVLSDEHNYFLIPSVLKEKPFLKQFYSDIFKGKNPQLKFTSNSISADVKKYLPTGDEGAIKIGM